MDGLDRDQHAGRWDAYFWEPVWGKTTINTSWRILIGPEAKTDQHNSDGQVVIGIIESEIYYI